jgi:hypothetical protein
MNREQTVHQWTTSSLDLITGMQDWRTHHPTATLTEIEQAQDARLAILRAQMFQDLALDSAAATWPTTPTTAAQCPACHVALRPQGRHRRRLRTHGGKRLVLHRPYGICPQCQRGFFPPRS